MHDSLQLAPAKMSSQKETNGATWYYRMHPALSLLSLRAIFGQSNMESPPLLRWNLKENMDLAAS